MASSLPHFSGDYAAALDSIIAEAADHCALEQIAALNTAHLSDSNLLPSHLESRFRKLKSLPNPAGPPLPRAPENETEKENFPDALKLNRVRTLPNPQKPEEAIGAPDGRKDEIVPRENDEAPRKKEPKSRSDFGSSPSFSADSLRELSPSPPRQRCCLGFSPRRSQRNKAKGDDVLSELGVRSLKEEQRKLKKALKEQEKVMRETQEMVKWVRRASAKMNEAAIDELLSDLDDAELKS